LPQKIQEVPNYCIAVLSQEGLGMKLNSEDRIRFMVDSHGDMAMFSKGVDFQARGNAINDKRVIPGSFYGIRYMGKQVMTIVENETGLSMDGQICFPSLSPEGFVDTLHSQTDA